MCRKTIYLAFFTLTLALVSSAGAGLYDKGTILFEWFNGTTGGNLNEAVDGRNRNYPDNPSQVDYLTVLQGPTSRADNYMTHVRGYLYPPQTGSYTFWTSSDDHSRLWLSTDADPANKKLIAEVDGYTGAAVWDKYPSQKSAPVTLQAGQKYYIEVLQRDGTGGDNLAVGWGGPGIGTGPVVIAGQYLSPFIRASDYLAKTPSPADGAVYPDVWVSLGWTAGLDAVSHDVYIGENADNVTAGTADTFRGNSATAFFLLGLGMPGDPYPAGLVPGTTYYWRVDEVEANGTTKHQGPVWSFFIPPRKAYAPSPRDGGKYVDTAPTLKWSGGLNAKLHYVYFGDNPDTVGNASGGAPTATTSFTPVGPLAKGKTYYWRVDEFDAAATHKGDVWSFTTLPDIAVTDPNLIGWWKLDEGEGTITVDWSGHGNHGEIRGNPQWVAGQDGGALDFDGSGDFIFTGKSASALGIEGAKPKTVTAWVYTRTFNNGGIFDMGARSNGQDFSLRTLTTVNRWRTQYWGGAFDHDFTYPSQNVWVHFALVYTGTQSTVYANGTPVSSEARTLATSATNPFQIGCYGWQANYFNGVIDDVRLYNKGLTPQELQVVMRGDLTRAWKPDPANGSTSDVVRAATLSWSQGDKASQHAVYFSTDRDAVANADTSDTTGVYRGLQGGVSYAPPEIAWAGGLYYWRVDEHNTGGTITKGTTWSFSVTDYLIVDDFEQYTDNDATKEAIWQTWIDGYNVPTNGAQVGNLLPPYAEQTIVHRGRQSMPVSYDNVTTARNSEAALPLTSPRDWTAQGVTALSLWYHAEASNVSERMYVAISNRIGTPAVVYNNAIQPTTIDVWRRWNIPLQAFADQGINLKDVDRIAIGFGTKGGTTPGGTGKMYIDDIGLYRTVPAPPEEFVLEAEAVNSITAPLTVRNDPLASGGKCIGTDVGIGNESANPPATGVATYSITVQGGVYRLVGRVIIPSGDSFWLRIPDATTQTKNHASGWVRWSDPANGDTWHWEPVFSGDDAGQTVQFTLAAGTHTLEIARREDGALLDAILITSDVQ